MPTSTEPNLNDLSVALLYRIMMEAGQLRHIFPMNVSTLSFEHVVEQTGDLAEKRTRAWYINRHLEFLEQSGYLTIERKILPTLYLKISLTREGQTFVQPVLAEFGQTSVLPQVVEVLERKMVLTYPQNENDGLFYNLREAIAHNAPDLIIKALIEIIPKIAS